jgi:hypothetical protein
MCGQFGIQACHETSSGMSMIDLDLKLLSELTVDRLNDLANGTQMSRGASRRT